MTQHRATQKRRGESGKPRVHIILFQLRHSQGTSQARCGLRTCVIFFVLGFLCQYVDKIGQCGWLVLDKLRWIGVDIRSLYVVET